jgi:Protein of unknown function (DUF4197)
MKKIWYALFAFVPFLSGCEGINDLFPNGLTEEEIIEGLKTALNVGSDSASTSLSVTNGYYGNSLVKIPLPPEAMEIRDKINGNSTLAWISSTIGLEDKFEEVVKTINRSAESAAKEAAPIFKDAITGLTISQGWDILNGIVPSDKKSTLEESFDSTAATKYLSGETYVPLTELYAPRINAALDKDLIGNYSATEAWESLTTTYNNFLSRNDVKAALVAAELLGKPIDLPSSINTDLGEFSVGKALDGLFLLVGHEEIKIRRDPLAWVETIVGPILEKVFGSK